MNLQRHLLVTGCAAALLVPFASASEIALFSAGSVFIDLDHLIFHFQRSGRLSIKGMFAYFRQVDRNLQNIPYLGICIFHTAECFLAVGLLSLFYPLCRFLLAGLIYHILFDIADQIRLHCPFIRAYSFVEHLIRRRRPGYPFF